MTTGRSAGSGAANGRHRNVLLVVMDQLRADCLQLAVGGRMVLPNMARLAEGGVTFRRHYSVVNPCGPSRASLLTGLYAMNHRSVRNGVPLRPDLPTIASEARRAGYEPLLFGYTDTAADPRRLHPDDPDLLSYEGLMPGFIEVVEQRHTSRSFAWRAHLRRQGYALPHYSRFYAPQDFDNDAGPGPRDAAFYRAEDSDTAFLTDACIGELAVRSDLPWLALLTYIRPHPPLIAPEPYNRLYDNADLPPPRRPLSFEQESHMHSWLAAELGRGAITSMISGYNCSLDNGSAEDVATLRAVYYGLATEVDHHVGRVVDFLKESGLLDSTLLVVTADHGEMLGDHWHWGKTTIHDGSFHVPLIIRDPERPEVHGTQVDVPTESVDLVPTILDWMASEVPMSMDGASLLPLLEGRYPPDWRDYSYSELDFGDPERPTALQEATGLALHEANLAILRERRFKLVHFNGGLPPLLFDMAADGECRNLADEPSCSGELLRLTRKLLDHRMRHADHALSDMKITAGGTVNYRG